MIPYKVIIINNNNNDERRREEEKNYQKQIIYFYYYYYYYYIIIIIIIMMMMQQHTIITTTTTYTIYDGIGPCGHVSDCTFRTSPDGPKATRAKKTCCGESPVLTESACVVAPTPEPFRVKFGPIEEKTV